MAIEDVAVRREVILPVDRETAWAALKDPKELATWLADEVEIEIAVGAQGWLRWEDGEKRRTTVEEVEQRRRLVLRWSEADGPETIVELVLDDVAEGTRLVVLELPAARLQAVARVLEQASPFTGGSSLGTRGGPQMVVALA
jgi:uncharacterized protein YndB with AHSA1/START domain